MNDISKYFLNRGDFELTMTKIL